jgi:murein L,D-transpeptidase YcbB/YkuD
MYRSLLKAYFLVIPFFLTGSLSAQGLLEQIFGDKDTLHPQHRLLQKKLKDYREIAERGGWNTVPSSRDSIKAGKRSSIVLLLKQRLVTEGYMPKRLIARSDSFDTELTEALMHYQRNNGLAETGYLNKATVNALNIPADKRVQQIIVNMDRWKLMPKLDSRYIVVNLPAFKMDVIESNKSVLNMKVVVGKLDRQTPVFTSTLTYLVLNPTWNIPQNVLKKDVLPKIKKDPSYLEKSHMTVYYMDSTGHRQPVPPGQINWAEQSVKHFPYEIIQDPGPNNSLGLVKFMFPNTYSVYMHDSPAKNLFKSETPLYSSGCVRLSNALGLAEYILEQEKWDKEKIREAFASQETQTVVLKKSIPVFIQYFTSWVDDQGEMQFRKDIYGLDDEQTISRK